jgi:hypothetical protein
VIELDAAIHRWLELAGRPAPKFGVQIDFRSGVPRALVVFESESPIQYLSVVSVLLTASQRSVGHPVLDAVRKNGVGWPATPYPPVVSRLRDWGPINVKKISAQLQSLLVKYQRPASVVALPVPPPLAVALPPPPQPKTVASLPQPPSVLSGLPPPPPTVSGLQAQLQQVRELPPPTCVYCADSICVSFQVQLGSASIAAPPTPVRDVVTDAASFRRLCEREAPHLLTDCAHLLLGADDSAQLGSGMQGTVVFALLQTPVCSSRR